MSASEEMPIVVRGSTPDDRAFIMSSFLRSYRDEFPNSLMTNAVYFARYAPVAALIADGDVLVAHTPGDESHILGWIAHEPGAVSYLYVKFTFRGMGIARRLFHAINPDGRPIEARHTGRIYPLISERYHLTFVPGVV